MGDCGVWGQGPPHPPQPLVDLILIRDCLVELRILLPSPHDIAKIAQADRTVAKAGTPDQSLNGDSVEALAFGLRTLAQLRVQGRRNLSEGVLHADSLGGACTKGKRGRHRAIRGGTLPFCSTTGLPANSL